MASLDGKYWYSEEAWSPTRVPSSRIEIEASPFSRARSRAAVSTSSIVACRRRALGPCSDTVGIIQLCLGFVKWAGVPTPRQRPTRLEGRRMSHRHAKPGVSHPRTDCDDAALTACAYDAGGHRVACESEGLPRLRAADR